MKRQTIKDFLLFKTKLMEKISDATTAKQL